MSNRPIRNIKKKKEIKTQINKKFLRLQGMKDIIFDEYKYWELVTRKATKMARAYGFHGIKTPTLERSVLYEHSSGKTSDIVSKEMYTFIDKSGVKIALRPEATPSLVRAYIENSMINLPQPVKMFWLSSVYRQDNLKVGVTREHSQFNLDIFGDDKPIADFFLIFIAYNFFKELQIDIQIQINSIGCPECRKEYIKKLIAFYKIRGKRARLCNDCKKRLVKNPLRLLDCKKSTCQELREDIPNIADYLCDDCHNHFVAVLECLDEVDVSYSFNPQLVRGLDYYNRTVFEIWPTDELEDGNQKNKEQNLSLGGGGRYDNLVKYMGGKETPAVGFGIGLERTILKIKENDIPIKEDKNFLVFIAHLGDQARGKALLLFEEMRKTGFSVCQSFTSNSLKLQLEEASRLNARFSLILGQKEYADKTILIRDMESGIQEIIDYKKIREEKEKRIKISLAVK